MSSGFVTESEIEEARLKRQEEWEKVRRPDQPMERPEEPYDGRSLYDRLKEQKVQKDLEYEEAHKLKNLIRGLDDDEVQFLELVDQTKIDAERKQILEDQQELNEFRNRVATLQEETVEKKIQSEIAQPKVKANNTRTSQKSLLGVGIKRKNGEVAGNVSAAGCSSTKKAHNDETEKQLAVAAATKETIATNKFDRGALKCTAILPGIGSYTESSDSEQSTDSNDDPCEKRHTPFDLCGRRIQKLKMCSSGGADGC